MIGLFLLTALRREQEESFERVTSALTVLDVSLYCARLDLD
jgi:hypothetical protein